jgi:predicted cobalt transporter CbtA
LAPFGQAVSEEKSFLTLANQKQELPLAAIFVGGMGQNLVPFGQQTWLLLLKIEHMVKLHVFGNKSKTINNIRNLMG